MLDWIALSALSVGKTGRHHAFAVRFAIYVLEMFSMSYDDDDEPP
jgi:hypothetical protein